MKPSNSPTLANYLSSSTKFLSSFRVPSARLDSLILLEHVLKKDRAYILSHPEEILSPKQIIEYSELLEARSKRKPVAYLTNKKEFYGREFYVDESVLIPRPESEVIIELLKIIFKNQQKTNAPDKPIVVDIGTGSGILAITSKLELPNTRVLATDIDKKCIEIARKNSRTLCADIQFFTGDTLLPLSAFKNKLSVILANLPYVGHRDRVSPETKFEPKKALFANDKGLEIYKRLLAQTPEYLEKNGYLIIEANPSQHQKLIELSKKTSLRLTKQEDMILLFQKLD